MKNLITILSNVAAVTLLGMGLSSCTESNERLWYQTPADEWMEAVPLGNGRLSAMVYGGTDRETIALNEISMWAGRPDSTSNDLCGADALAEMRQAFFAGDVARGNELGNKYLNGRMTTFGTHVPVGDLVIDFNLPEGELSGYERSLDLSQAVAAVDFTKGGTRFHREYIADYPDDVLAMRFTASGKSTLTATVGFDLLRKADITATADGLEFTGTVDFPLHGPGGVNFCGTVKVIADGGTVIPGENTLTVSDAEAMTLLLDIRTDYNNTEYRALNRATVEKAASVPYARLRSNHQADYSCLYDRMSVRLGKDCHADLPTDLRLKRLAEGGEDTGFDVLFFNYGRYMLIASSRPSGMPLCANLQGIWNDNGACNMPWTCDYHMDINTAQNYWAANRTNLAECNLPLFSYLGLLADHGRETARKMYGSRGWVAHTVCNAWGYTAPGWGVSWGMNVTGGAWLATHLWSHYLYTCDKEYLAETAYPILRECAQFFSDYMCRDPRTGYLLTGPSISPENGFVAADGGHYSLSMMPTIDRVLVYDIYNACIQSADILGIDDDFTAKLRTDIAALPPLATDEDGLLREWLDPVKRSDPSHRHSSHVLALFPYNQISNVNNPELIEACRKSLDSQTSDPAWEDTEWSTANMLCFRARTKEGDAAYGWLRNLYKRFMRENLMTVSPAGVAMAEYDIFSFDATEGAVAGMCEMLLQSHDGYLDFLPALPSQWNEGEIKGLCAEGGITVDMAWKNGKMSWARLKAGNDTDVKINGLSQPVHLPKDQVVKVKF
jgi:glycoside hydrolase family 95